MADADEYTGNNNNTDDDDDVSCATTKLSNVGEGKKAEMAQIAQRNLARNAFVGAAAIAIADLCKLLPQGDKHYLLESVQRLSGVTFKKKKDTLAEIVKSMKKKHKQRRFLGNTVPPPPGNNNGNATQETKEETVNREQRARNGTICDACAGVLETLNAIKEESSLVRLHDEVLRRLRAEVREIRPQASSDTVSDVTMSSDE